MAFITDFEADSPAHEQQNQGVNLSFFGQSLNYFFVLASFLLLVYVTLSLSEEKHIGQTLTQVELFIDESGEYDIHDVLSLEATHWQAVNEFNFGATTKVHWLRLPLKRGSNLEQQLLLFEDVLIDSLEIYFVDKQNGVFEHYILGDKQLFEKRPIAASNFMLELPQHNQDADIYIRAQTSVLLNLNAQIWNSAEYLKYSSDENIFYGLVFGYILALFCYALLMFATSNNKEYAFYAGYLLAFALHIAAATGFAYHYLWPDIPYLQQTASTLSINIMMLFLLLFTQEVLGFKKRSDVGSRLIRWQIKYYVALIFLGIFYYQAWLSSLSIISLACFTGLTFFICLNCASQHRQRSVFFSVVWLIVFGSALISILERFNFISLDIAPTYLIIAGFNLETLLIGLALINMYRINQRLTRRDRELALVKEREMLKAKDSLIETQRHAQDKLEREVQEQTAQLESALQHLSKASQELKHMRNVDGLTGLPNRYLFSEHIACASEYSVDNQRPLAIAVLDLDHFKVINDKHGHQAGDAVLKTFANMLHHFCEKHALFACRFGGEEFIVVGQNLSLESMTKLMEDVRLKLSETEIVHNEQVITCTVSIGITCSILARPKDYKDMLAKADTLLYAAKQNGRNQVVSAN
uniref:sensor domain-containing diguanylate cyclase n=1 Tax=Ningiella ruwaisensis TaxID=2364274 RepID=UPI0010A03C7C|nr:diguanylate cyclase [Ningiella ruwaisensis]